MTGRVAEAWRRLVSAGELKPDPDQQAAVEALDRFLGGSAGGGGLLARVFGRQRRGGGVYLWGGVGRGKSMLLDLSYGVHPSPRKRRVHFHAFMLEVHERLRAARQSGEGDPVIHVAKDIADELDALFFDEMMVTNPADAMIMSRLFSLSIRS